MRNNMKMNLRKVPMAAVLMALALVGSICGATVPTDSAMSLTWVGQKISHNGYPMNILHFSSPRTAEQVLQFYRSTWAHPVGEGQPGFIEQQVGQWHVISRLEGDQSQVVQVKSGSVSGSEGFISDMNVTAAKKTPAEASRFPKPAGSQLISHTAVEDYTADALTLIIKNGYSPSENKEYYLRALESQGFTLAQSDASSDAVTLFFLGDGAKIDVAIGGSDDGGSIVFANIIGGQ